jgi:GNAT superfamily N-acetyltransferase
MDHAEVVPELAGPADLASLVVTFAAAFSDDAMIRWPMPDATPVQLRELFRLILEPYVDFGVLWKIDGCSGGAAWLTPEVTGRFDEIEQSARAAINPLTDDDGVRYAQFWDWLGAHLPGEPCWFLDVVAVAPAAQGRGLGRKLVTHGLELARADGCPAFLETSTPRNVPFYESLGFQVVDQRQAPGGGPVIWFMQTPRLPRKWFIILQPSPGGGDLSRLKRNGNGVVVAPRSLGGPRCGSEVVERLASLS